MALRAWLGRCRPVLVLSVIACSGNTARSPDAAADAPPVDAAMDAYYSYCGNLGQACCKSAGGAIFCTASGVGCQWVNRPKGGVCQHCGENQETCCDNHACNPGNACRQLGLETYSGTCLTCGQAMQPCCDGVCGPGLTCQTCNPIVDCPQPTYNPNDVCRSPDGGVFDAN
jgi:hypothetical protein